MRNVDSKPASEGRFLTTRWSVVLDARGEGASARASLALLCRTYWYPLYAFVRRQGFSSHDAQDLTQAFFARLLEKERFARVDADRGRFRSWLLASMKHFLANEWDKSRAKKRGGDTVFVSIDHDAKEARYAHEPSECVTPETLYDRRWALTLLERVLARLREELAAEGKASQFDTLKGALTGDVVAYADIAAQLGLSDGAVRVAVHRLRLRYRDLIRAEIAETVASPAEIDEEIRHLFDAMGG